ncbi:cytochrome c3 family protein [Deltaproteobacteria bacterium IMCC39524]|nr:cytochrome c3 family protein [Deltaproteobacteria bacterium IMCC39524]
MKRLVVVFCLIFFTSSVAWGVRGPAGVRWGSHNLSLSSPDTGQYNHDEDAICVFCHTPHGGTLDAPLWNRGNPTSATWKHYNSASLSSNLRGLPAGRPPNTESMLCLSCHDGSLSVNHVLNEPNDRTAPILGPGGVINNEITDFFGVPGARIGGSPGIATSGNTGDFTDDHPFSFSYTDVMASPEYSSGQPKFNTLRDPGLAVGQGVRFFTGALNVECSSCHDPHVNFDPLNGGNEDYSPFLITPNTGSALCLACHIK